MHLLPFSCHQCCRSQCVLEYEKPTPAWFSRKSMFATAIQEQSSVQLWEFSRCPSVLLSLLTKNGPISSIAPSPREEHPGPEIPRKQHLSGILQHHTKFREQKATDNTGRS